MIGVLCSLLLPMILGYLVLERLLQENRDADLLERITLSFPLGIGLVTMQMFVLGLLRAPLTLSGTALPVAAEIAVLSFWRAPGRKMKWEKPSFPYQLLPALLAAWAGLKIGSIWLETGLRPLWAWDSWFNWSAGAKLFYHSGGLMLDEPARDFFGRGAVSRFLAYPVHNPLMQVWISLWAGTFDEVLVKFTTPLYLTSMALYFYRAASRETSRLTGLALLVLFLSSPLLSYHAVEVYSDIPLSVYILLALGCFLRAMRGGQEYWPLVGLFSAQALLTKDEALFFVVPLLLSAVMFSRKKAAALLAPLLFVVPWYAFKFYHQLGVGADNARLVLTFHPEILKPAAAAILSLQNFNVFFVFLPGLMLLKGKPSKEFLHLALPVACYALFFFLLYACTTVYHDNFTSWTVFFRNLLTYYPAVALLTALLLKPSETPQRRDSK